MIYRFFKRASDGRSVYVAQAIRQSDGKTKWSGKTVKAIQSLLAGNFAKFKGPFDESKDEHWKLLPQVLSGSRLWAVAAKTKKKSIVGTFQFRTLRRRKSG